MMFPTLHGAYNETSTWMDEKWGISVMSPVQTQLNLGFDSGFLLKAG